MLLAYTKLTHNLFDVRQGVRQNFHTWAYADLNVKVWQGLIKLKTPLLLEKSTEELFSMIKIHHQGFFSIQNVLKICYEADWVGNNLKAYINLLIVVNEHIMINNIIPMVQCSWLKRIFFSSKKRFNCLTLILIWTFSKYLSSPKQVSVLLPKSILTWCPLSWFALKIPPPWTRLVQLMQRREPQQRKQVRGFIECNTGVCFTS